MTQMMKLGCWSDFPFTEIDDCVDASWDCNGDCCRVEAAFRAVYDLRRTTLI